MKLVAACTLCVSGFIACAQAPNKRTTLPGPQTSASSNGACTVANVGNANTITIRNCGIGKAELDKIVSLLKEVVNTRDPEEINGKLDKLLRLAESSAIAIGPILVEPVSDNPHFRVKLTVGFKVVGNQRIERLKYAGFVYDHSYPAEWPGLWAKRFRSFLRDAEAGQIKANGAATEMSPEESGSITIMGAPRSPKANTMTYLFLRFYWADRDPGEADGMSKCIYTSGEPTADSQWKYCSFPDPTPAELQYEAMGTNELSDAIRATIPEIRQEEERREQEDKEIAEAPWVDWKTNNDQREKTLRQQQLRWNAICQNLGAMVEEAAFRLGANTRQWTHWVPNNGFGHPSPDYPGIKDEQDKDSVSWWLIRTPAEDGGAMPLARDVPGVLNSLDALSLALRNYAKEEGQNQLLYRDN